MSTAIVVHGGAGLVIPERHARLREGVRDAAAAGHAILDAGGSALDAVVAAVRVLEDDPEFNAGTGSALTREGKVETDASVMDGATQRVGAVAAVPHLRCPVALARAILDAGEHVILSGVAALRYAATLGIAPAPRGALITDRARTRLRDEALRRGIALDPRVVRALDGDASALADDAMHDDEAGLQIGDRVSREVEGGTVGAVARDRDGRFAAATSTGGVVFKRPGRIGDSPIPGAGTWADRRCAISATGDGEAILRVALAHTIAMRGEITLVDAVTGALRELQAITGGTAGLIAIDARARAMLQLTETMPVAWIDDDGAGDSMGQRIA